MKYGMLAECESVCEELMLPAVAPHGWRLTASYQNLSGDLGETLNFWEVESADAAVVGLSVLEGDAAFEKAFAAMRESTVAEHLSFIAESPHSP